MEKSMKDAFWKREEEANHTRRKSLDNLPYITIPLEELPLACHITGDAAAVRNTDDAAANETISEECKEILRSLSTRKSSI